MKVAVIGAGGIGGYVGGRLAEAGAEVSLIARGAHLAAIQKNGLRIETPGADVDLPSVTAVSDPHDIGPVDLIISAVKMTDAEDAAQMMKPLLADHTRVLTMQNGIDGPQVAGGVAGRERVAAGTIFIASYIKEPGVIFSPGGMNLINVDRMGGDPVIAELVDLVGRSVALSIKTHEDPNLMLWQKFVPLAAFSGTGAATRLSVGYMRQSEPVTRFFNQLVDEGMAVAEAAGVSLTEEVRETAQNVFTKQPDSQKPSLLVDIEAGKPCEIRYLSGTVHRLGQELGVPTPGHSAAWAVLSPYEFGPPQSSEGWRVQDLSAGGA